jgi:hypothetical protein
MKMYLTEKEVEEGKHRIVGSDGHRQGSDFGKHGETGRSKLSN